MNGVTAFFEGQKIDIPAWVVDLESFHRWVALDVFPKTWRVCYLQGRVWMDMTMEEMNHNQIKGAYAIAVGQIVVSANLGRYFHDGMRVSNVGADLSAEPDGAFVSDATFQSQRVQMIDGDGQSPIRLEGTPDMVLEVVSPSSVEKDTVELRQQYWNAGIPEYWLVNPLDRRLEFEILRHTPKGYSPTRKQGGWLKSAVFGKSFQLTHETGADGYPMYTLAVR